MTQPNPPVDYTSKDYAAFRQDMLDSISTRMPEWTSRSPNDFGVVLIELFSYMGDILSYYGDRIANESFLETATLRQSVFNISKMLDYTPSGNAAARVTLQFTTSAAGSFTIPKGTAISTAFNLAGDAAPVIFETDADAVIADGTEGTARAVTVTATQGKTVGKPTREAVGISNGTANQSFDLYQTPVIDGSVQVFVDEGQGAIPWEYFENLIDANQASPAYTLNINENGTVAVIFGDGTNGHIPVLGAPVSAIYRVGGGERGNVGANTLTTFVSRPDSLIGVEVNNPAALNQTADNPNGGAYGGADAESLDQIRVNAPKSLRALNRAVTLNDYASLAQQVTGIAKANAVSTVYTSVTLYVAPNGGGSASPALKQTLSNYLETRKMINTTVTVQDPTYIPINVTLSVNVLPSYQRETTRQTVNTQVSKVFTFDNVKFGQRVTMSSVYQAINSVMGVEYSNITLMVKASDAQTGASDIVLAPNEIPVLGTLTVTATGGVIV